MTIELPREPIHSPFGGSVAARVLRCPASVGLIEKVPAYLRKVSAYADRGTALHEAMALLLDEAYSLDDLVGKTFGTYTITHDDIANALQPAFAHVVALLDTPGAEFFLEARITFPTVAGAFGTADLIVRIGRTVHVIDLKFGVAGRKEHFRDRHGEEAVDQEVEPFEHVADRGGDDHAGEPRPRRRGAANCGFHGHCPLLPFPALPFATEPRLAHVAKRREAVWRRDGARP